MKKIIDYTDEEVANVVQDLIWLSVNLTGESKMKFENIMVYFDAVQQEYNMLIAQRLNKEYQELYDLFYRYGEGKGNDKI